MILGDAPGAAPQEAEIEVRVEDKYRASDTVVALHVARADGDLLPPWEPGAHVDFLLPNGLIRQYSLCGDSAQRTVWRFGILREEAGRGGSAFVHGGLNKHDVLRLKGPRNRFPLVPARRYCFIAGGVGITPILPMVRAVQAAAAAWTLHYGGRSRASMAFTSELAACGSGVRLHPQDEFGLLNLDEIFADISPGEAVYCCGPEPLIQAVESRLQKHPEATLHVERFTNADAAPAGGKPFSVRLRRSQKTIEVGAGESILEAVERAGLKPSFSCREGACGTCETVVLAGRPDHRDAVLSPTEKARGKSMMICVSRSLDDFLELDL